jgi:hypothetical protein
MGMKYNLAAVLIFATTLALFASCWGPGQESIVGEPRSVKAGLNPGPCGTLSTGSPHTKTRTVTGMPTPSATSAPRQTKQHAKTRDWSHTTWR